MGAFVITSWSSDLVRDTGATVLDMVPDRQVADGVRQAVEAEGGREADLHLWRLGPGHLGAILVVATAQARRPEFHWARLTRFPELSHVTVEVQRAA